MAEALRSTPITLFLEIPDAHREPTLFTGIRSNILLIPNLFILIVYIDRQFGYRRPRRRIVAGRLYRKGQRKRNQSVSRPHIREIWGRVA